jgi:transposase
VLRLMREHTLLSPHRARPRPDAPHDRHIITAALPRTTVERDTSQADAVRRKRWTMTAETKQASGLGRGARMSRQRKRDVVLRLLRGEDLEMASRSLGVTAATLTGWRDTFLAAGEASLATRPADGEALESERLKARLGEMLLTQELLEAKIAALEGGRPLARRRPRP